MKIYSCSEQGPRDYQQDSFYIDSKTGIFFVADGLGGHFAGDLASKEVVDVFKAHDFSLPEITMDEHIQSCLLEAHQNMSSHKDNRGTTVTLALVNSENKTISIYNSGDSRAYLVRKDDAIRLTVDNAGMRGLTAALGCWPNDIFRVSKSYVEYEEGDVLVLTTDGIHDYLQKYDDATKIYTVTSSIINRVINDAVKDDASDPAKELVELALKTTRDNCTAVVVCL